jgi:hypothetical protein
MPKPEPTITELRKDVLAALAMLATIVTAAALVHFLL